MSSVMNDPETPPGTDAPPAPEPTSAADAVATEAPPQVDAEPGLLPPPEATPEPAPVSASVLEPIAFAPTFPDLSTPTVPPAARRRGLPVSLWLLAVLIPYAVVATAALVYLLQQSPTR